MKHRFLVPHLCSLSSRSDGARCLVSARVCIPRKSDASVWIEAFTEKFNIELLGKNLEVAYGGVLYSCNDIVSWQSIH